MANSTAAENTPATDLSTEVIREERSQRRTAPLDKDTAHLLMRLYMTRRVDYQIQFYRARIREFDNNSDMMFRLGALVMSISSLLAALSLQADSAFIRMLTAILPALAALIAAFRQLYQWERQAGLYRDSILGLEEARLVVPDLDVLDPSTAYMIYPELVKRAEQVFQDEVNQWGQVAGAKAGEETDIDALKAFAEEFKLDIFSADGSIDEEKIGMLRDILEAGQGSPQESITIEVPQRTSLPAGRGGSRKKSDADTIASAATDDPGTGDSAAG